MLEQLTSDIIFSFFLVFARIGSALMLLPGISQTPINIRSRLALAFFLSLTVSIVISDDLPAMPQSVLQMFVLTLKEVIIGGFIGTIAKIIQSSLHTMGQIVSYQMGLSAAMIFDPSQSEQGSMIGSFLNLFAIFIIFTTDLHLIFIGGLFDSYEIFIPLETLNIENLSDMVAITVLNSFMMGLKLASPQLVIGLLLYVGAGVMGRLMPQMQVFFVLLPVQIYVGFTIFALTLSMSMVIFIENFSEIISSILII